VSETTCCPLTGNDGPQATVYSRATPRTARDHSCTECGKAISRGTRHEAVKGLWEDSWCAFRTCLSCAEIRDHFNCGEGFWSQPTYSLRTLLSTAIDARPRFGLDCYGQLWEDLRENFFSGMKAGGSCMEGLSPVAKQKLIDERMEWYFEQDEIDDGAWAGWAGRSRA
jgi:hypothetical protein